MGVDMAKKTKAKKKSEKVTGKAEKKAAKLAEKKARKTAEKAAKEAKRAAKKAKKAEKKAAKEAKKAALKASKKTNAAAKNQKSKTKSVKKPAKPKKTKLKPANAKSIGRKKATVTKSKNVAKTPTHRNPKPVTTPVVASNTVAPTAPGVRVARTPLTAPDDEGVSDADDHAADNFDTPRPQKDASNYD
jgi:hypothetical protein